MNKISIQELGEMLSDSSIYRCKSETCSDNGGVCTLIVHCMFDTPQDGVHGCMYSDDFPDDECECEWEQIA